MPAVAVPSAVETVTSETPSGSNVAAPRKASFTYDARGLVIEAVREPGDAGSLYLLDEVKGEKVLRWKLAQNDSIDVESFEEKILPITRRSLAGFVALTGETLVIGPGGTARLEGDAEGNQKHEKGEIGNVPVSKPPPSLWLGR